MQLFSRRSTRRRNAPTRTFPAAEALEGRQLPATFGVPWPDARSLSVSFPTDNTSIGAYGNSLRDVLDQVSDRREWQETALRAFQTWAVQANVNIGLVPDRGDALGTIGLASNDPRFGEFRLGAFPQPGILASALPYQQIAGTWSGDVLLNTQTHWFLADWKSTSPITVPQPNEKGPAVELFSVLLHEAGNALGVADTTRRGMVMYTDYEGPKGALTAADIAAIRRIYGARQDVYEPVANNARASATRIVRPAGHSLQTPLTINGSLNSLADVDFYRFTPVAGQDKVTVRLMSAGISLLKARLEVLDSRGQKIADVKADSIFENNLQLEIGSLGTHRELFVRVAHNSNDVFGVGDYRIELDYRPQSQQPSITPPPHDADAVEEDNSPVPYVSIDALFSQGLVNREQGTNDTLSAATVLTTTIGFNSRTRYEAQASIASATDRDFYRFTAPAQSRGVLNIDLSPIGTSQLSLDVVVMNAAGDRLPAVWKQKADGARALQISNPVAGAVYIIGVQAETASVAKQGNYLVTIDFATEAAAMQSVFSSSVTGAQSDYSLIETGKPQFFRFDLSATAATSNEGVQLSFYDARTQDLIFALSVPAGSTTTEFVWLTRGAYIIKATPRTRNNQTAGRINFTLRADVISDDQGPNPVDPTMIDPPGQPPIIWTDPPTTPPPVVSQPTPLFEDPWYTELLVSLQRGFYSTYYR